MARADRFEWSVIATTKGLRLSLRDRVTDAHDDILLTTERGVPRIVDAMCELQSCRGTSVHMVLAVGALRAQGIPWELIDDIGPCVDHKRVCAAAVADCEGLLRSA